MANNTPESQDSNESLKYDVIIIGAGPSGLSAAIRLGQLANQHQFPLRVCVLEKGSEIGAHAISGAVFEPRALNELIPDWQTKKAPLHTPVTSDAFGFLSAKHFFKLPLPPLMHNQGNYIISLSQLCRWLGEQAAELGIELFPGFAAAEVLYNEKGEVSGVRTQAVGLNKKGEKKPNFEPGIELKAKYTLFAEGCRGSLTKTLHERFRLSEKADPQTYGIGVKEIWEIDPAKHRPGSVLHTIGWPLERQTYGGSFVYHFDKNLVSIGFVVGLDYENPYLDPFEELQQFKRHPHIRGLLEGGRAIAYGARALNEGGFQSVPKLSFPGGLLIGCAAGFLNVPKLKGNHTAMKSGMLAAETIFKAFVTHECPPQLLDYENRIQHSWIWTELWRARNIRPAFRYGLAFGLINAALETYVLRGRAPWTLHHTPDYLSLKPAAKVKRKVYPKPDGVLTFDKLTAMQWSNTHHEFDQPVHLRLRNPALAINYNLPVFDSPETRYCPAGVYEIVRRETSPVLQINAQNCLHCKTCDIKDPRQNIDWVTPEGGGGPFYTNM